MAEGPLTTAHERWDAAWRDDAERAAWIEPEPAVAALVAGVELPCRALDVGCGVGRHSALLARSGVDVVAIDASREGIVRTRAIAPTAIASFVDLPFRDAAFDYVVAWNVVYHGDGEIVAHAIGEIARVLRTGGTYQGTMLSTRNRQYGRGTEIRPHTFVVDADRGDKMHPHFYCDKPRLCALHEAWFDVGSLVDVEQGAPGSFHWSFVMTRR